MSCIFANCTSLKSLPDLSKWNTENVTNMNAVFAYCTSLRELPDISKWNTSNVFNLTSIFWNCSYYYLYLIYLNGILVMLYI